MLSMVEYAAGKAEKKGTKNGKKLGIALAFQIQKIFSKHPDWTDQQIAESCGCDEEDVKQVRDESNK